jgi:hypothetical protein
MSKIAPYFGSYNRRIRQFIFVDMEGFERKLAHAVKTAIGETTERLQSDFQNKRHYLRPLSMAKRTY